MAHKERMFGFVTETWNPVKGCSHGCQYCYARDIAKRQYADGFAPRLIEERLAAPSGKRKFVFVVSMGDLFGEWVPSEWIVKVLNAIRKPSQRSNTFLFLTKNPKRFQEFLDLYPSNAILGTTLESNRDHHITLAPSPEARYPAIRDLDYPRKFVSVEPILDFDPDEFVAWLAYIAPELVSVGYDNHGHGLPEPPISDVLELIESLRTFTKVDVKDSVKEKKGGEKLKK